MLANLENSTQGVDIKRRTPLVNDYFRIKLNCKSFCDSEKERQGVKPVDFSNNQEVIDSQAKEFDMPFWAFIALAKKDALKNYTKVGIVQLKACNLFCPWCYVDDSNKNAKQENGGAFFSIDKIVDMFESERTNQPLNMMRFSGGEPSLIADHAWLGLLRELEKRKLDKEVYVQGDTNLTTGHFLEYLDYEGEVEINLLEKIANYRNFGLLCSFKSTDPQNFCESTGTKHPELHEEQFYTMRKIVKAGIDAYPFIYDPNPETLEAFMARGAKEFGDAFCLKTWILPLKLYGPEKQRLEKKGVSGEQYQKKLDERLKASEEMMQKIIWNRFHINYKAIPRTGLKLEAN